MPSEGRRLHPFTVVSRALRLARQLLVPAILGGASVGDDPLGILRWVFLLLAIPSILLAAAHWFAFRFRLEDDDLVIDSGILARRRRVIPIDRVQNVDLEQSAMERMVGVAELRIETASGGRETEASLAVLAVAEARAVQADLLQRRPAARAAPDAAPEERRVHRLSTRDLALAGATSNEAGLIAAGLATLLEMAARVGALEGLDAWIEEAATAGGRIDAVGIAAAIAFLVLVFLVLGWFVSIVTTVVRFHGFTLTRVGDDIRREYGLLSRHHTTVPLARVQAVRVEETLLRRALGLVALKIETAGAGPQERRRLGGGAEAYVPLARRRDVPRLLREALGDVPLDDAELHPVAPPSRRREFVRLALMVGLLTAALASYAAFRPLAIHPAVALSLLVPAWFLAGARYRARAWGRVDGFALARNGVLTRTTWIIPRRKIQTVHLTESPFQRRWGLGTLHVDTAAGGRVARIIDLHRSTAAPLLEQLGRP
jgi:putative membrane protein